MKNKIKLSVCVITYNHSKYISKAIESFLMQKVNFDLEVVIADDASTDINQDIIRSYQEKYPKVIRPILRAVNIGVIPNLIDAINHCTGKYIALCEGDDYWTDPLKLQKQVDFLEQNNNYSASAHQSMVIYEHGTKEPHLFNSITSEEDFITDDLIALRKFHTASFIFRGEILKKTMGFPKNIVSGDRALFLLCASSGPIKFFPDPYCVYRKNENGISTRITVGLLKKDLNIIPWIANINPSFPKSRFRAYIHRTIIEYPDNVNRLALIKHFLLLLWFSFSYFPENIHEMKGYWRVLWQKI